MRWAANRLAAQLSGIRTDRLTFLTFVNMGVLAGLAGLIVAARLNSATPSAGQSFELDVIAACFIGGASASGGVGKVMGVVIGAFVMGVMNNGMSIYGLGIYWQMVVKGIVLLSAVYVDVYQKNKGEGASRPIPPRTVKSLEDSADCEKDLARASAAHTKLAMAGRDQRRRRRVADLRDRDGDRSPSAGAGV